MKFSYFLVFLFVLTSDCRRPNKKNKNKGRIYGGRDGSDGQFPYAVFHIQRTLRGYHTCSGGIIGPRWVLTAAHCVNRDLNPSQHIVVAGKADLNSYIRTRVRGIPFEQDVNEAAFDVQERRAAAVFYHPMYSRGGSHDVGLIRVQRSFVFNNRVSSLPISRDAFQSREDCTLAGYGLVENDVRRYIIQYISGAPARPAPQCRFQRLRDVICLGDQNRGMCHGDSGGPLVCGNAIRGVASHGISRERGCGKGTLEQYYTDTQRNLDWIDQILGRNNTS